MSIGNPTPGCEVRMVDIAWTGVEFVRQLQLKPYDHEAHQAGWGLEPFHIGLLQVTCTVICWRQIGNQPYVRHSREASVWGTRDCEVRGGCPVPCPSLPLLIHHGASRNCNIVYGYTEVAVMGNKPITLLRSFQRCPNTLGRKRQPQLA